MAGPNLNFTISGTKVSNNSNYNYITVEFQSDINYINFECRATKNNENFGLGIGTLITTFSFTPANTQRTFEVYNTFLTSGDGEYRISLYAQSESGTWNDNHEFIPKNETSVLVTSDDQDFLCGR